MTGGIVDFTLDGVVDHRLSTTRLAYGDAILDIAAFLAVEINSKTELIIIDRGNIDVARDIDIVADDLSLQRTVDDIAVVKLKAKAATVEAIGQVNFKVIALLENITTRHDKAIALSFSRPCHLGTAWFEFFIRNASFQWATIGIVGSELKAHSIKAHNFIVHQ